MMPTRQWNEDALDVFKQSLSNIPDDRQEGKYPKRFGKYLKGVDIGLLPDHQLNRAEVLKLTAKPDVNTATVCAAALAWGGMNTGKENDHHIKLFDLADDGWLDVAEGIRAGMDRKDAYNDFASLKQDGKLFGVGPAYFTKLIYFLTPRDRKDIAQGYIMDQWAGCSINMLLDNEGVVMDVRPNAFTVSDGNTGENYEKFCAAVDELREIVDLGPDELDQAMSMDSKVGKEKAKGGEDEGNWREYVRDKRVASICRVREMKVR